MTRCRWWGNLWTSNPRWWFDFALQFARTEKRGGVHPIIEHQAVGYALADAKTVIESTRYLCWRACHALDTQWPSADELAIQAKIYGSEAAVRVITDLMRVVGISTGEDAITLLGKYFPISAASSEKQRFLLKNMNLEGGADAPKYPR